LLKNPADIILLMIGTSDILNQYKLDRAPERLDNLIGRITTHSNAHLLVSTIPPNYAGQETDLNADVKLFNSQIPAIVNNRQSSGFKVSPVDAGSKLSREDMLQDGLLPNIYGNQKIAAAWFDAIVEVIKDIE
jgi:lysophospholipase L1-like esterase